jgi:hypothetical protein
MVVFRGPAFTGITWMIIAKKTTSVHRARGRFLGACIVAKWSFECTSAGGGVTQLVTWAKHIVNNGRLRSGCRAESFDLASGYLAGERERFLLFVYLDRNWLFYGSSLLLLYLVVLISFGLLLTVANSPPRSLCVRISFKAKPVPNRVTEWT